MKLQHILNVYLKQKEHLRRTKGWGKPIILLQYKKQFKGFNEDEIETIETYLKDEKKKWFVAALLDILENFSESLLIPILVAAVDEPDPSSNNDFIRPCRRVFGYEKIHKILMDIFTKGNNAAKIGVLKALYWARPTVYSFLQIFDGNSEIKKGYEKFVWKDYSNEFEEEFVDDIEVYNKEHKKLEQIYIQEILTLIKAFNEIDDIDLKYQIALRLPDEIDSYPDEIKSEAKAYLRKKSKQNIPADILELNDYKNIKQ